MLVIDCDKQIAVKKRAVPIEGFEKRLDGSFIRIKDDPRLYSSHKEPEKPKAVIPETLESPDDFLSYFCLPIKIKESEFFDRFVRTPPISMFKTKDGDKVYRSMLFKNDNFISRKLNSNYVHELTFKFNKGVFHVVTNILNNSKKKVHIFYDVTIHEDIKKLSDIN